MNLLYDLEKVYDSNKDKIGETIVVNEKINRRDYEKISVN